MMGIGDVIETLVSPLFFFSLSFRNRFFRTLPNQLSLSISDPTALVPWLCTVRDIPHVCNCGIKRTFKAVRELQVLSFFFFFFPPPPSLFSFFFLPSTLSPLHSDHGFLHKNDSARIHEP